MISPAILVVLALTTRTPQDPAETAVAAGMQVVEPMVRGCFELRDIPAGDATLRFHVGVDGRPLATRIARLSPENQGLERCLLAAVGAARFRGPVLGTDVEFPVRFRQVIERSWSSRRPPARSAQTLRVVREPRLVGSSWMVEKQGRNVSDLDLALAAGDQALHGDLLDQRNRTIALVAVEGVVAAAGLAVGIFGAANLGDTRQQRARDLHAGLAVAGGGGVAVGGSLFLYHLFRLTELEARRPVWHSFDVHTAGRLVDAANGAEQADGRGDLGGSNR